MTSDKRGSERVDAPLEQTVAPLTEPFRQFARAQSSSGWLLLAATIVAIGIANSSWGPAYFSLLHIEFGLFLGDVESSRTLQHWVNDGLMALFFFLLGLELKRELMVGRLSDLRQAGSVLSAAVGGMLAPALLFLSATSSDVTDGWAIPLATDTAFALMILVLLGDRIPAAARAFLVGLAIVDDLGAILIIALAYTKDLELSLILPAAATVAALAGLNLTGVRSGIPYLLAGTVLWVLFTQIGLHGTLTGVVVALSAPVRPELPRSSFVDRLRRRVRHFEQQHDEQSINIMEQPEQLRIAEQVEQDARRAAAPLARWESHLEKPISFLIMPLFAFMNAGVLLPGAQATSSLSSPLTLGILLGLLVGKPVGILLGLGIGRILGVASLPDGMSWRHALGVGLLGGIGFTMSLFIATLSFGEGSAALELAKRAVIGTSLLAGVAGYCWLRWFCANGAGSQ